MHPISLQWTKLPIISNAKCKSKWDKVGYEFFEREMVCAGFLKNDSTGFCKGDSGGPLICHQNGKTVLAGVISWSELFCETHLPYVFARVSNYIDWIKNYMEKPRRTYTRTNQNQGYVNTQEFGKAKNYEDAPKYGDSHGNSTSQRKVSTHGLKALCRNSVSCPKLPKYMLSGAQARIIHGHRANTPIPWQVSIQTSRGDHFCGGTILDKTTVVTAAHCLDGKDYTKTYIIAGKVSKNSNNDGVGIAKVIIHPKWNWDSNDIALIKLSKPLTFDKNIKSMCLPSKDFKPREGEMCIASGWGDTKCKHNFCTGINSFVCFKHIYFR